MSRGARRALWAVIGTGTVIRLVLLLTSHGEAYDMGSFKDVAVALRHDWLHMYSAANPGAHTFHWPYPPAYLPWIAFADAIKGGVLLFDRLIRLPAVAADAALAWLVATVLARRVGERAALAAAALVALGPVFVIISGYHGQIDSLAILPAVVAAVLWERGAADRQRFDRALAAGALIGLAGAIKTVPIVMVLALLPSARDWREGARLVLAAAAVPALMLAPFLIADANAVRHLADYGGVPGAGGLSLVAQPDLARFWLTGPVAPNSLTRNLVDHQTLYNLLLFGALAVFFALRRPAPMRAATILWLAVWAFGTGFFFQYLVWGLPFLILDRHLRAAALLQVAVLVPMLLFYLGPWHRELVVAVYATVMLVVWVSWCVGLYLLGRRGAAGATAIPA
jgi:4-amino-4-deoxy-L-arabinose transferase-like glycosyltransferase